MCWWRILQNARYECQRYERISLLDGVSFKIHTEMFECRLEGRAAVNRIKEWTEKGLAVHGLLLAGSVIMKSQLHVACTLTVARLNTFQSNAVPGVDNSSPAMHVYVSGKLQASADDDSL